MLLFFPRGVLDEILNLIESVSEGFPSYFLYNDCVRWCSNMALRYLFNMMAAYEGVV